jgi:hypothetical protein
MRYKELGFIKEQFGPTLELANCFKSPITNFNKICENVREINGTLHLWSYVFPYEGGVVYLHRSPASHRRRQKGKSQI